MSSEQNSAVRQDFQNVLAGKDQCLIARNKTKAGELIDVEIRARDVELGGYECVICTVRNITTQKKLEAERVQMLARLETANLD
jgi:PAS domain S-box-containing protein